MLKVSRLFVGAWVIAIGVVTSALMMSHWVPLPHPQSGEYLRGTEVAFGDDERESGFHVRHFLYDDCPCSMRVLRHLESRGSVEGVTETVVLISERAITETSFEAAGFSLHIASAGEVKSQFGVESAPLFVVATSSNKIVYAGGYTSRKQGFEIQDTSIIRELILGKEVAALPVFGCAVSKRLKQWVDPLGIKY